MAAIAGPLIGAAGSLLGGFLGGGAAKRAGQYLNQTGINVAHSLEQATSGAINAGYAGMGQASTALQNYLANASGAYGNALQTVQGATGGANQAIATGVAGANQAIQTGVGGANQALQNAYAQQMGLLSPYLQAGGQGLTQLQAFLAPGGPGSTQFNASMMEAQDPGYQFRLQQGAQALQRGAAATGGVLGAAQQKALDRYSQDYASNEYQNAFNRYMAGNAQQFGMLQTLANYGQGATNQAVAATGNVGAGMAGNIYGGGMATGQNIYGGGQLTSGNIMTGGERAANIYGAEAGANLGVGQQLANEAMQGNQWIGQTGMAGAQAAGNAYMQGAQGMAAGMLGQGQMMAGGLGGALGSLGGGLMSNYWMTGSPWGSSNWGGWYGGGGGGLVPPGGYPQPAYASTG